MNKEGAMPSPVTSELDNYHLKLKRKVDNLYRVIKNADAELERVRKEDCRHPQTETVNYAWAIGHVMPDTEVCVVCGEVKPTPLGEVNEN